jgi:uncharacterized protein YybS (DUF2232 family)
MPTSTRTAYAYAGAVLAGCISATVFELGLNHAGSLTSLLIYVTTLPLFLAGLGAGTLAGVAASGAGFISLMLRDPSNYAVLYTLMYALPTIVIAALALHRTTGAKGEVRWLPEGYLLTIVAAYPCVLFLFLVGIASTHEGGLMALTQDAFARSVDSIKKVNPEMGAQVHDSLPALARYLPSAFGTSWIFVTVFSLMIAQKVLQQHKWNIRSSLTLRDIRMPSLLITVVALCGVAAVFTTNPYSYVGANLAIILGLSFFFVGLAVLHAWAGTKKGGGYILFALYILLFFMPLLGIIGGGPNFVLSAAGLALIVTLLGAVDQWADFRQRLPKQPV